MLCFKHNNKSLLLSNKLLDDNTFRQEYSKKCLDLYKTNSWDVKIYEYIESFNRAINELENQKVDKNSDSIKRIINIIKRDGSISKKNLLKQLNWGVMIDFTKYRNILRKQTGIKFTKTGYVYQK